MTVLADRMSLVRPSATKAMTQRAAELVSVGQRIITLSQGEPDFATPTSVSAAGVAAIEAGHTRYTPVAGIAALREAVVEKFQRDSGLRFEDNQVIVGCGAKQVIFNALLATLSPGDEVIIPAPCWVSYPDMVLLAGGVPVPVMCPAAAGFKLTPESLERSITPDTKWLLLNSPSNPTGAVYSAEELSGLAEVLRKYPTILILCDDIYEKLVYDDATFATMASAASDLANRTLTVNGVSKTYAMTGWRVGYGAGPLDLISAMNTIQGQTSSHTSSVSQHAAVAALTGDQSYLADFVTAYDRRRHLVVDALSQAPGLSVQLPDGAFYAFVDCSGLIGRRGPMGAPLMADSDVALHLLERAGVAVVPGSAFLASPFFRVCYAVDDGDLEQACEAIVRTCKELS